MILFILQAVLLGLALAMDAFSISIANGINESGMSKRKTLSIPLTFAFFQFIMPLIGWYLVRVLQDYFESFQQLIPYIALVLLYLIGGKMIASGLNDIWASEPNEKGGMILNPLTLFIQGIATSIDALSVGLTISEYRFIYALQVSIVIAVVTFIVCMIGIRFGKRIGNHISTGAGLIGGMILMVIGTKIFLSGI